jgi:hypothetical protein
MAATPQKSAKQVGRAFGEYLRRALTQSVALREPKDVAWFLASYARDALQRVEEAGDLPALASVRSLLEEALGVSFEGEKGEHFFRSTLVQTAHGGVAMQQRGEMHRRSCGGDAKPHCQLLDDVRQKPVDARLAGA